MSKFKVGDKVRCTNGFLEEYAEEKVYSVGYCAMDKSDFGVIADSGYVLREGCIKSNVHNFQGFDARNFELVEPKDPYAEFRNLPVGTKIVLRDDLEKGQKLGGWLVEDTMLELKGMILTIDRVTTRFDQYYTVGDQDYISPEMIDRVITEVIEEPKGFEIIEVVKYNGEVLEEVPSDSVDGTTVYKSKQVGDTHRVVVYNHSKQEVTATWTVTKIV